MTGKPGLRALTRDERGVSAVEFALLSPVLILLLAASVDLGGAVYAKFQLDSAVNAASNYALSNAASVNSTQGPALASSLASLAANVQGTGSANASITVNAGPTATSSNGSAPVAGGAASSADSCYCPTGSAASVAWGSAASCGSPCGAGGYAGKWVAIQASADYTPIFSGFGIVHAGQISASAMVQAQ